MENTNKKIKDIYTLALTYFEKTRSYEQCLRKAIVKVLETSNRESIIKFLGKDGYLDFLNYSKQMHNQNYEFF